MIKKIVKKMPGFTFLNALRRSKDFYKDMITFNKFYLNSEPITKEKIEYNLLLEIHKLEKGFAVVDNVRPFGKDKILSIINNINKIEEKNFEKAYAYDMALSSLQEYSDFYEKMKWTNTEEYKIVNEFLSCDRKYNQIQVGAFDLIKNDFIDKALIDYDSFLSSRRSVRNFSSQKLTSGIVEKAVNMAIKTPTACNRQMCKIYYIKSKSGKEIIKKYAQGLGLFDLSNANFFVITFDLSSCYFTGERNQGWFNSGLVAMNFINALHSLGIGSCAVQFGNSFEEEVKFKKELNIPENERISVIITAGYYDQISRIPYSTRKPIKDIFRER